MLPGSHSNEENRKAGHKTTKKQQAEYFADYLGATVSGSSAALSALQRMGCSEYLNEALLRNAYSTSQSGAHILGLFRQSIASLPDREWQWLTHAAACEGARLDAAHPPTGYRIDVLRAHSVAGPGLAAEERAMSAIDAEPNTLTSVSAAGLSPATRPADRPGRQAPADAYSLTAPVIAET
jgi:hypothetical protein